MKNNSKLELIKSTFKGEPHERIPLTLWKHFPKIDQTPQGLAKAQLDYQEKYNFDLMKISPHGRHCTIDWGGTIGGIDPVSGSTQTGLTPFSTVKELANIEEVDPLSGELGKQIEAVRLIKKGVGDSVPLLMTVFSPIMVLGYLDSNLISHIQDAPKTSLQAIEVIARVMKEFAEASLDAGADGIFYASKYLSEEVLPLETCKRFSFPGDLSILHAIKNQAELIVLHLHGKEIFFREVVEQYPITAVNWHDRLSGPSLVDAGKIFKGGLMGGIEEHSVVHYSREKIALDLEELKQEIQPVLNRVVIAPGCVLPITISSSVEKEIVKLVSQWKIR